MAKSVRQSWTCLRCIRRQRAACSRRLTSAAAAAISKPTPSSPVCAAPSIQHDDSAIRQVFDSPAFWRSFSHTQELSPSVGLFRNHYLKTPAGFEDFARVSLAKCRRLVKKVLAIESVDGYKTIVKDLDRLSDLLCRIIDLSDFVRSTHPDPSYQRAATGAHMLMFEYMNTLNTTTGLYDQLVAAMGIPEVESAWTEEEKTVARILKKDFEQSAINLPQAARARFVDLSNQISALGAQFVDEMQPARPTIAFQSSELKGVDPTLVKRFTNYWGQTVLPTTGPITTNVLRSAESEGVRRQLYIASRTAADSQTAMLEELLLRRAELARLSGFSSYASMSLMDKMAKSPEAVVRFLDALAAENGPRMKEDIAAIREHKKGDPQPWDIDFYRARRIVAARPASRTPDFLPAFFSLGTVIQGLSRLFSRLYGVRFVPREPSPGETWSPDVRRLDVVSETSGLIAVVYCDLFARSGKSPNPAHFTLRCSRLITPEELAEQARDASPETVGPAAWSANDGMAVSTTADGQTYQLPTIALICDFHHPSTRSPAPTLLSPHSLTTLFHEMGHAIHSILGRTRLQNVSGTRCATDFAELPSVLMERFALDPAVLGLYARHWETDAPLPPPMAAQLQRLGGEAGADAGAADTESQVLLARLDQALHSVGPADAGEAARWSDAVARRVWRAHASLPEPRETRWQGFFGHLVGYGGCYYAYLFDRAIAGRVWTGVFGAGRAGRAVDRAAGERFAAEVLRWGGGRDPWRCVAGLVDGEDEAAVLAEGKERAMEMVGRWGVGVGGGGGGGGGA